MKYINKYKDNVEWSLHNVSGDSSMQDEVVSYLVTNDWYDSNLYYGYDLYAIKPLTFRVTVGGNISFSNVIYFSTDGGKSWSKLTSGTNLFAHTGDVVSWAMSGTPTPTSYSGIGTFSVSNGARFTVEGNPMSLIWGLKDDKPDWVYTHPDDDYYLPQVSLPSGINGYAFKNLFAGCGGVTDASNLYTKINQGDHGFEMMFAGCTNLEVPPKDVYISYTYACYGMFSGCTSLKTIIPMNSTGGTAGTYACENMYSDCTSLTEGAIPGSTPSTRSYGYMYQRCSNLRRVHANWRYKPTRGTDGWSLNVASSGVMVLPVGANWYEMDEDYIPMGWAVIDENGKDLAPQSDYKRKYFTVEAITNGTLRYNSSIEYSLTNGSVWQTLNYSEYLSLNAGNKVLLRGTNKVGHISYTGTYKVYGNIMSLKYSDNFTSDDAKVLDSTTGGFAGMFSGQTGLADASNLILPATTLISSCYKEMFSGCTNMTSGPTINSTPTLAVRCFYGMFKNCGKLTSTSTLPASITDVVPTECYAYMYSNCSSITSSNVHFFNVGTGTDTADTTNKEQMSHMFEGCTKLSSVTLGYDVIYQGVVNGTSALTGMFSGCTSLTEMNVWFKPLLEGGAFPTDYWVDGIPNTGSGKFKVNPGYTWYTSGDPSGKTKYCWNQIQYGCSSNKVWPCRCTPVDPNDNPL